MEELLSEINPSSVVPPFHSASKGLLDSGGIAVNILRELYIRAAADLSNTSIALSAWTLSGSRIIDLLAPSSSSSSSSSSSATSSSATSKIDGGTIGSMEFASVHCPTYVTALQILQTARKRAFGA